MNNTLRVTIADIEKLAKGFEIAPSGCWVWKKCKSRGGYGQLRLNHVTQYAHRVLYIAMYNMIPKGLEIDHLCRVRACVNPLHLEAVTRQVNVQRGLAGATGAALQKAKTHCPKGHEYNEYNARPVKTPWGGAGRRCRLCSRDNTRRYRLRKSTKTF